MAAFGTFTFPFGSEPIMPGAGLWSRDSRVVKKVPLGSNKTVIENMGPGSRELEFDVVLLRDDAEALEALQFTTATFTDWGSPVANSRSAFLEVVKPQAYFHNTAVTTDQEYIVHIRLVEQ